MWHSMTGATTPAHARVICRAYYKARFAKQLTDTLVREKRVKTCSGSSFALVFGDTLDLPLVTPPLSESVLSLEAFIYYSPAICLEFFIENWITTTG